VSGADVLREISGFSGIGAGHDREDFIFREDFSAYSMRIFRQKKSLRDHVERRKQVMAHLS
jgi:hypothetical protein